MRSQSVAQIFFPDDQSHALGTWLPEIYGNAGFLNRTWDNKPRQQMLPFISTLLRAAILSLVLVIFLPLAHQAQPTYNRQYVTVAGKKA
jgi:hypothetical protein